jgi:nitrogen fixation protein
MKIDIRMKEKGIFSREGVKHDITEPIISVDNNNIMTVSFYHTNRKGTKRHYELKLPKDNLSWITIRRTLDKDGN